MKQKSTAEIRENERKKLQKQFDYKYKHLTDDVERYKKLYHSTFEENRKYCLENSKLKQENDKLKEENIQLNEWIERLQEFVDMPDDQRSEAVKEYIESTKNKANINALLSTYTRIFSTVFHY